jgi:epsilon-lactone hydrolase
VTAQTSPWPRPMSLRAVLFRKVVRLSLGPIFSSPDMPLLVRRKKLGQLTRLMGLLPPGGVRIEPARVGGVPGEWVIPKDGDSEGALLYLHGGAYVVGQPPTYRALNAQIAREARVKVCVLDYRLAPEHPCPAAIDDALAAYRALLDERPPSRLVLGGDSAGGGLVMALLLAIRDAKLPMPSGAFLISPWVDLHCKADSYIREADRDVVLSRPVMRQAAGHYAGDLPHDDPRVSPVRADLSGLPPLFIQSTDAEVLADDSAALLARAQAAEVDATLERWPGLWHDWQVFAGKVPEATQAVRHLAQFVAACLK